VITGVAWRGALDGEVVLTIAEADGPTECAIDRPGDLVARMMAEEFSDDGLLLLAAMYGYCLASRGIEEPVLVDMVIAKVGPFLRSARMESLTLYRLTERVAAVARAGAGSGVELRRQLLAGAHRLSAGG
jgi:hypothetical protein